MQDYSLNVEEQKNYILTYDIEDGIINVYLAIGGEPFRIPYTQENEQLVISKMEEQAREAKIKPISKLNKILAISSPFLVATAIFNMTTYSGWICGLLSGGMIGAAVIYPTKCIIRAVRNRGVIKSKFFLNCQQEFNDNINNENMLLNVSEKAVNQIKCGDPRRPLNINDIENYSLKDLRTMKDNLDRIKSFRFNENKSVLENQGNCYKKTVNSKK